MDLGVNYCTISGKIVKDFEYHHSYYGNDYYMADIECRRDSGVNDYIHVLSNKPLKDFGGKYVNVEGSYHVYNLGDGHSLQCTLLDRVEETNESDCSNEIVLKGVISKDVIFRETPKGRLISDLCVAVNRTCGRTDYIPCIAWGDVAKECKTLTVSSTVEIIGRMQSRIYFKKLANNNVEERVASEISVRKIKIEKESD